MASGTVLSIVMLAAMAMVVGAGFLWRRRGPSKQVWLMLVLAVVLAANVLGPEPTEVDKGNDVLGQIFGSKDVSRTVATHASNQTGIDPALLKKMLPILAMLVAGYMAHAGGAQQGEQSGGGIGGMLGSVLGSVLGGGAAAAPASTGMGGMLGSLLGMATGSGSSNALDEIIGMAGKLTQR